MLELKSHFENLQKDELILDVRTPAEFTESHVPNAKHIPFDLVMNHVDELKHFKNVYVYCRSGNRSYNACAILESLGLKNLVCIDEGGMPDWNEAGYPSTRP